MRLSLTPVVRMLSGFAAIVPDRVGGIEELAAR
jgi:hypothetical protein